MELRQLKYFVAVADLLNFTKAASSLYITQPTLSQQINALEADLGTQLFYRERSTVSLTEAGRNLLPLAKELLENSEAIKNRITFNSPIAYKNSRLLITMALNLETESHFINNLGSSVGKMVDDGIITSRNFEFEIVGNELAAINNSDIFFTQERDLLSFPQCNSQVILKQNLALFTWNEAPLPDTRETVRQLLIERPLYWFSQNQHGLKQILPVFAKLDVVPTIRFLDNFHRVFLMLKSHEKANFILPYNIEGLDSLEIQRLPLHVDAPLYLQALWKQNHHPAIPVLLELLRQCYHH